MGSMSDELTPREDRRGATATGSRVGTEYEGHRGNLPHIATDENRRLVEKLAGLQISQAEVALVLDVSPDTIQRHYPEEFARGKAMKGIKLREHAYDLAFGVLIDPDDPAKGYKAAFPPSEKMTQFMLERQFGMVAQNRTEHVGDPERPVEITHIRRMVVDPKEHG